MEGDPFAVDRGDDDRRATRPAASAATSTSAASIPQAQHALEHALDAARTRGFLGDDVMGEGFAFDVEIRRGAGAYICGEETAIFDSIEGKRGEPRNKPPFPVEVGLFGKPTVVNNVETLVNVLDIVLDARARPSRRSGPDGSTGHEAVLPLRPRRAPGRLRGRRSARRCASCSSSRAASRADARCRRCCWAAPPAGFLGPDELDVPLTFEGARAAGTTLGSGVVLVLDETVDLPRLLMRIAAFFRDESCGQCVPCRVGTVRQEEALARLVAGEPRGGVGRELALHRRGRPVHARRVDLRARPDGVERGRVGDPAARTCSRETGHERAPRSAAHGRARGRRAAGARLRGRDDPRRLRAARDRHADALLRRDAPARERLPRLRRRGRGRARARARRARARSRRGWRCRPTRSASGSRASSCWSSSRSSVDLSTTPVAPGYLERYAAEPERFGPPAPPERATATARGRPPRRAGRPDRGDRAPARQGRQRALRPRLLEVHPLLQVRRRLRRAVPEHVRHPRRRPRLRRAHLDRVRAPLPESACVYCGNCIAVCPTGALDVPLRARAARGGRLATRTSRPSPRRSARTAASAATLELHVQDNEIVKVTSPDDHDVTRGNLCIKGRFGFQHVQARKA